MNFYKLPVASSVTDIQQFKTSASIVAHYGNNQMYIATDTGDVYVARVDSRLFFIAIGYGYVGFYYNDPYSISVVRVEVESTSYNTIYAKGATALSNWAWDIDLNTFLSTDEMLSAFYDEFVDLTPITDTIVVKVVATAEDSNDNGGTSGESEGTSPEEGGFDDTSDPIPPSSIPSYSCTNSGLVTLFRPTEAQLNELGNYLWTNITDFIENLNKLFMNPMDYLIALNIFPVVPAVGTAREIKIGSFTTSITMSPVISQWVDFDCGSIMIPEYWGSYLDYAPYTKIHAMLPFVGSVQLNTDEVMNKMLSLRYRIDLLSGMCVAMLLVDNNVYYQFTGECGVTVPLTGADWSRVYSAAIGAIGTAITAGVGLTGQTASTGATAALAQAKSSEAVASNVGAFGMLPSGVRGVQAMREHAEQAAQMALQAGQNAANIKAGASGAIRASAIATAVNGTVNQVISGKAHIQHSGTLSGSAAILGVREAYVMLEYPNQSLAESYKHFVGYPSNMKATLGSLSGYTECEQVIVGALPNATDGEREELITALKGGVYL